MNALSRFKNVARLGNLDLAMTDFTVTLGGVTIPMIRTYSSGLVGVIDEAGNGGFASDYSAGWNLNFLQSEISVFASEWSHLVDQPSVRRWHSSHRYNA